MTISKLLIANRGEIACRIIGTARRMGIATVAVYSDADRHAPHVTLADEAVAIGPSSVGESYMVVEKLIHAAKATGADAIHPGYGFLSENASFAAAVGKAGLTFVGPPPKAIEVMGDKARAKRAMIKAGVPCIPGYEKTDQADERFVTAADSIGYPVMVKASAGGGGRGMRLVHAADDLPSALSLARSEAENAFGSGDLILEKAIVRPRHVEVQVFADAHGTCLHLGERDCSVQRRHQKVIEEAPCPVMTDALREKMGKAAVAAARAVDYRGAGTVEFLLDENGEFYFLEMNTRLQVEHPVTEEVTGLDLVELQLRVANGEPLGFEQSDVALQGHAIEVRLYAEDPANDFLPSTGHVDLWHPPTGPGIRVDDGIRSGGDVSPFYDPMVAKIIAKGATRNQARTRLVTALQSTAFFGPANNRDFLIDAINRDAFAKGEATTAFIGEVYGDDGYKPEVDLKEVSSLSAAIEFSLAQQEAKTRALAVSGELLGWTSQTMLGSCFDYRIDETEMSLTVRSDADGQLVVSFLGESTRVDSIELSPPVAAITIGGKKHKVIFDLSPAHLSIAGSFGSMRLQRTNTLGGTSDDRSGSGLILAPMHGKLLSVEVAVGDTVSIGQRVAVLEAMKMQHEILVDVDGKVTSIGATPDVQISADALIIEIEPNASADT